MMEQARIQDGGRGQSPTPSHFLQTPDTHAAESDSWTLLGKMLSVEAGRWEGLEKVGCEPERRLLSPGSSPFLEKKQAWQPAASSVRGRGRLSCCLRFFPYLCVPAVC